MKTRTEQWCLNCQCWTPAKWDSNRGYCGRYLRKMPGVDGWCGEWREFKQNFKKRSELC